MKNERYPDVKRPTVTFDEEEHRIIQHYRIDLGMKIGEFLKECVLYCVENGIDPRKRKKGK